MERYIEVNPVKKSSYYKNETKKNYLDNTPKPSVQIDGHETSLMAIWPTSVG